MGNDARTTAVNAVDSGSLLGGVGDGRSDF